MTLCFDYLLSLDEEIAVKAFSLTVLNNLSILYPEIKQELKTIIEDRWEFEKAAFHSRAKKILNEIGQRNSDSVIFMAGTKFRPP